MHFELIKNTFQIQPTLKNQVRAQVPKRRPKFRMMIIKFRMKKLTCRKKAVHIWSLLLLHIIVKNLEVHFADEALFITFTHFLLQNQLENLNSHTLAPFVSRGLRTSGIYFDTEITSTGAMIQRGNHATYAAVLSVRIIWPCIDYHTSLKDRYPVSIDSQI